jgi:hypothetical protein
MTDAVRRYFRLEEQVILLCARTSPDDAAVDRLRRLLAHEPDWTCLLRTAAAHNVIPLLLTSLQAAGSGHVPHQVLGRLTEACRKSVWRTEILVEALCELTQALGTEGIAALPFKGPVLGEALYGDYTLRPFSDLDVLVRDADLPRALSVCAELGYRPGEGEELTVAGRGYNIGLHRAGDGVKLELHWRFSPTHLLRADASAFWSRAQPRRFRAVEVQALEPTDLLIALSVHGTKHWWTRVSWIADVAQLLRRHPELNLLEALDRAAVLGCRRMVALALVLAHELLDAPLDAAVYRACRSDAGVPRLARQVQRRLFHYRDHPLTDFGEAVFLARAMDRPSRRVRYLLSEARAAVLRAR